MIKYYKFTPPKYFDYQGRRYTFVGRKFCEEDKKLYLFYNLKSDGQVYKMSGKSFHILKEKARQEFENRKVVHV